MDIYSDIKYTISERRTILFRKGIGCDACRGGKKGAEVVDEMDYKVINAKLLLSAEEGFQIEQKDFWVKDGKITFSETDGAEVVDAKDKLVMPGLINMHTHAYMTVMRNYADDVDFGEWLFQRVMPVEDRLPKEGAYWTSLLAFSEMIKTGTTSFVDMHMFHRQSPQAAKDAGMRGFIGRGLVGEDLYSDGFGRFQEALEEKREYESSTLKFILSPHAIYSCSTQMLEQVSREAERQGMLKQIHLSESDTEVNDCLNKHGKTPVKLLEDIGFLDEKTILAHCVKMCYNDFVYAPGLVSGAKTRRGGRYDETENTALAHPFRTAGRAHDRDPGSRRPGG